MECSGSEKLLPASLSSPESREAIQHKLDQFVAIAERSVVVGYGALIGAAVIT